MRDRVASSVTEEFLARHPDGLVRYGERARRRGVEDARFHVDFLAGAVEAGSVEPFEAYAAWAARMLEARGIAPERVAENLFQVGAALCEHLNAAGTDLVRRTVTAGVAAALAARDAPSGRAETSELGPSWRVFLRAALAGDRRAALTVAREAIRAGHPVIRVYDDVLRTSQYEVGRMWETNEITVAKEHLATAVTQYVVAQLYEEIVRGPANRGKAIVTGVEGEMHLLGGLMLADVLEADVWHVRFLGTNLPADGVARLVAEEGIDLVGISATMLFSLPGVVALMSALAASRPGAPPRILVGGGLFRGAPGLWRDIGADGYGNDLRGAVKLAAEMAQASTPELTSRPAP